MPQYLQFAMYQAIQRADRASLRTLAETFIGVGNDPAALLCLDHVFSSPLDLRGLPLNEVQASLSLYLNYIRLFSDLRREGSLAEGSKRQRLFGFQVLGRNRYLAPKHTVLHDKLSNRPGLTGKGTDGHGCGSDEILQGILQFISGRIDDRTETQDNACRDVHGFSPCLHLLVQNRCSPQGGKGQCTFQHVQSDQLTVDWYHARLRPILIQFQILDLARCDKLDVKQCVPAQFARNA